MAYGSVKQAGEQCSSCLVRAARVDDWTVRLLMLVNGALVCPTCDCVDLWPNQRS